jgi:PAS domain S-box-containing protein
LADILGKRPEDIIGKSLFEVYPPETADQFSSNTKNVFATGKSMLVEETLLVNGQDLCISSGLNPVLNAEGNVIAVTGIVRDVTERRKEERELQESQERFRVIFEGANDGILVADIKTQKFVLANPQMCNMLGYPLEDLLKMSVPDIHPKEALPAIAEQFRRMAQGEKLTSQSIPLLRSDKQILECEVSPGILDIWDQKCLVGFFRDVTERKKTEASLSLSEAKLRSIVENSSDQIFMIDRSQKYLFANKVLANILGKLPEDIIGKSIFEVYPKETADQSASNTQNVFTTGKNSIVEETMVVGNQELCVSSSLNPITDDEGRVLAVTGIIRDITENKKMETILRDSEEKYRAIVEQSALGILIAQGPIPHIVFANSTIAETMGYSAQEMISFSLPETMGLVYPDDREIFFGRFKERLEGKSASEQFIIRGVRKDKSIVWMELASALITYGGQPAVQAMFVDITKRKKAEEELANSYRALEKQLNDISTLKKELESSNKLLGQSNVDLENYTYVVSHDLKAPLRAIRSFSTFILEDYNEKLDETGKDYFQRIIDASTRMDALIENLLLLSRVGRKFMEVETVDLNQLLAEIVTDLEPTLKKNNGKIVFQNLPKVTIPRTWMKQIFMNLTDNGLKFNKSPTPTVEITYQETDTEHLFKVADNGIGIEEKYYGRLFGLFERLHTQEEYPGTGAGLAICKKIVQQFGGKIWIESQVGKGTTFFFTLAKNKSPTVGGT